MLFLSTLTGAELDIARGIGLMADVVSPSAWSQMSTSEFESYRAIIVGDPNSADVTLLEPIVSSRQKWSPAIKGNIIVLGSGSQFFPSNVLELTSRAICRNRPGRSLTPL